MCNFKDTSSIQLEQEKDEDEEEVTDIVLLVEF
jgi:hypothetical protein